MWSMCFLEFNLSMDDCFKDLYFWAVANLPLILAEYNIFVLLASLKLNLLSDIAVFCYSQ